MNGTISFSADTYQPPQVKVSNESGGGIPGWLCMSLISPRVIGLAINLISQNILYHQASHKRDIL